MSIEAVSDRIRQDYGRFPHDQSYDLYAPDVYFQDPLNRFRGVARYQAMIAFMQRWFLEPTLELQSLELLTPKSFRTHWTLRWIAPLPWQPRMAIAGWTDYKLDDRDRIVAHIDYWHCSRWDVFKQLWQRSSRPG